MNDDDFDGFEWDEAKSSATFEERGIAFHAAARVFGGAYVESEDTRHDYGEPRYRVTGMVDGVVIAVVWTPRGRNRRIITAWPATNREQREFHEHCETNEQRNSREYGRD